MHAVHRLNASEERCERVLGTFFGAPFAALEHRAHVPDFPMHERFREREAPLGVISDAVLRATQKRIAGNLRCQRAVIPAVCREKHDGDAFVQERLHRRCRQIDVTRDDDLSEVNKRNIADYLIFFRHQDAFACLLNSASRFINVEDILNTECRFDAFGTFIQFVEVSDFVGQADRAHATAVAPVIVNRFWNLPRCQ